MQFINFFHRKVPVDSLCLYRIAFGFFLFIESLTWLPHTTELFSNRGFHVSRFEWLPSPDPSLARLLCILLIFSTLMMALGTFTRVAIGITTLIWSYFYALDQINEKAIYSVIIVVLTILFFSPCANRYSIDLIRRRRKKPSPPREVTIFTLKLLQIEFAQIYFFSGITKMMNPDWVNGTALFRILNSRWATDIGVYLSSQNLSSFARLGSLATVFFELFAGFLLFVPGVRIWVIIFGLFFHMGIQTTLWVGSLGAHFILALFLIFPEPETIAKNVKNLQQRWKRKRRGS